MVQLIVRNIEDEVVAALQKRAAARGRSAEAEHRVILREAVLGGAGFRATVASIPDVGQDEDLQRVADSGRDVALTGARLVDPFGA
ncbi:hypothetical protein BJF86_02205 [Serinicoccus sp. CNJ-927]|uniref:FitA-like ribbon-helix-helix domain-containing protein n=1 Tax=Serinicoccus sp. CNJ-927 TaxID=1904970 RepID=UPI00095FCB09|nr:hypothetical protein [Serinicoccus sp. CNJ-927]OLT41844.1 hypothetical protein BJF86_02205 [Serinicoccus sp. CNJ-927]